MSVDHVVSVAIYYYKYQTETEMDHIIFTMYIISRLLNLYPKYSNTVLLVLYYNTIVLIVL